MKMKTQMSREPRPPTLRICPTAWAKLLYLRDCGDTEVGGFAIGEADDPLHVIDFALVRQTCSPVSVAFEDASVADFFDRQVDEGRHPEQFARIWVHTHPGDCPLPSWKDEDTFARVFGRGDWAMMFILAREGQSYARLRFNCGPGGSLLVPVEVDYQRPFAGSEEQVWRQEYQANVQIVPQDLMAERGVLLDSTRFDRRDPWDDERWLEEFMGESWAEPPAFPEEEWRDFE